MVHELKPGGQHERLLRLFRTGGWYSTQELRRAPGSDEQIGYPLCRREDLEKWGWVFEGRWRDGSRQKEWRLVSEPDEGDGRLALQTATVQAPSEDRADSRGRPPKSRRTKAAMSGAHHQGAGAHVDDGLFAGR